MSKLPQKTPTDAAWLKALVAFAIAIAATSIAHANAMNRIEQLEKSAAKVERIDKIITLLAHEAGIDTSKIE